MASVVYAGPALSRHQRRRMVALADDVDRPVHADRRFFERFPQRSHRLRLLSIAERDQMAAAGGQDVTPPFGEEWAVAVRQVAPGARIRRFFRCHKGSDLDQPESVCRETFDAVTAGSEYAQQIEAGLREAFGSRA